MVTVRPVQPSGTTRRLLAGAQFADAYRVTSAAPLRDARAAAQMAVGRAPGWISLLMALRNVLVAPFGLKRATPHPTDTADRIGIFPVLSETPGRIVAGLDDRHLDFRLVIDVEAGRDGRHDVTLTTVVLTHNRLGRLYLATIMPFHRLVARTMLGQVTARAG